MTGFYMMGTLVVKRLFSRVFTGEVAINLKGIFKNTDDGFVGLLIPQIIFFFIMKRKRIVI